MNIFHLDGFVEIFLLNCIFWLVIHFAVGFFRSRIPNRSFNPRSRFYRPGLRERDGKIYEQFLRIKRWKHLLPDFGKFKKSRLASFQPEYLKEYLGETCRAELTHVLVICSVPLFSIWNPVFVALFMLPYALAENLLCITVQRYNRARLLRVVREFHPRVFSG